MLANSRQGIFYQGAGYAVITDYSSLDDYIQLQGSASNYKLTVQGSDTIISLSSNNNDWIGVIQGRTDMSLTPRPGRVDFKFI